MGPYWYCSDFWNDQDSCWNWGCEYYLWNDGTCTPY